MSSFHTSPEIVEMRREMQAVHFTDATSSLVYMPLTGDAVENTSISAVGVRTAFPAGGYLKSFTLVSGGTAFGSTTVGLHKNFATSPAASLTLNLAAADTRYKFDFAPLASTFLPTDIVHISWNPADGTSTVRGCIEWVIGMGHS